LLILDDVGVVGRLAGWLLMMMMTMMEYNNIQGDLEWIINKLELMLEACFSR